ncbi:MAG: MASE1 domain-containing protein [Thermoleophilia bacterium]
MPRVSAQLGLAATVAGAYALGSQIAYWWFGATGVNASFFPAAGVTVAALVLTDRRRWPVVLAAAATAEVAVDLAHGLGIGASLGYAAANCAQPLLGALLLARLGGRPDLGRLRGLGAFVLAGVVAGPALGGCSARRPSSASTAGTAGSASQGSGGRATGWASSSSARRSSALTTCARASRRGGGRAAAGSSRRPC